MYHTKIPYGLFDKLYPCLTIFLWLVRSLAISKETKLSDIKGNQPQISRIDIFRYHQGMESFTS